MQGGLLIDFDNSGGHAVLVMKAGTLPTLLTADFTFRSEELVKGDQVRLGVSCMPLISVVRMQILLAHHENALSVPPE